ncbi:uncharacterized protein TRAVEDRAFT_49843 [Trametes versicolor FP-101664 SS1]|uniref:uncharacterized protein n=1 Tax=Trametes versicolor (strain FP-101664) TaxID=717944 RepID=UPI00046219DA|nr:uncharacterized protein TRAVEDRAFT_49843 [Trametes versicolor FP-101664 SS1]EIW57031.1 hypothetical protein TRAVEDRAFT_49843 [Trametes versicolor FP-101664 SS1]
MDITVVALQMFSHPFEFIDYILPFIDPVSSILNCRFLLALYGTTAQLERGGTSASSFSLDLGDANLSGTPDLPEFLTSFAGPIHSTPDDDQELFDQERTLPREHDLEVDVGVLNSEPWMEAEPEALGLARGSEGV